MIDRSNVAISSPVDQHQCCLNWENFQDRIVFRLPILFVE
jgi:hypothetical protein